MKELNKDFRLSDLPKHNVYQVPEKYFDRLPMRVMERTAGATAPQQSWLSGFWQPMRYAVAPLMLLLIFVAVFVFNTQAPERTAPHDLSDIADKEIVEYLNNDVLLETADFADLAIADQNLAPDFLNISSASAERELEYYQLNEFTY
ncbi:hypothetical protein [Pontibacter sp. SGAir0037]|uniref:hypothetical protein n=1 Tax=Pontibacter sp. SGAir0037 TaxID=2571030 RepID=UPI0010CD1AA7|nr:hypothetical protein [Pontibacter sp. SGAir0037]QCR21194.1 hypothetical protein C1N53_01725 [Pontibacter sp. SGAir0037]